MLTTNADDAADIGVLFCFLLGWKYEVAIVNIVDIWTEKRRFTPPPPSHPLFIRSDQASMNVATEPIERKNENISISASQSIEEEFEARINEKSVPTEPTESSFIFHGEWIHWLVREIWKISKKTLTEQIKSQLLIFCVIFWICRLPQQFSIHHKFQWHPENTPVHSVLVRERVKGRCASLVYSKNYWQLGLAAVFGHCGV